MSAGARVSILGGSERDLLAQSIVIAQEAKADPLWIALAKHVARISTPEDRALLVDLATNPGQREAPLSWGLQFMVRGDILLADGNVVTLDELCQDAGLPPYPMLEEMPPELEAEPGSDERA